MRCCRRRSSARRKEVLPNRARARRRSSADIASRAKRGALAPEKSVWTCKQEYDSRAVVSHPLTRSAATISFHSNPRPAPVIAYLNGQYLPRSAATIPVEDRGFIFGDGVYEVWRVVNGRLFETDRHLARLRFGLRELRIEAPDVARREGLDEVPDRLLTESGLCDGEATLYRSEE